MVHFESPSTSQESSKEPTLELEEPYTPEAKEHYTLEDNNIAKVEDLLQRTKATVTVAIKKLTSYPGTPAKQTSSVP